MRIKVLFAVALAMFALSTSLSWAQEGHFLTLVTSDGEEHAFHLDELDSMQQVEFSTTTIWTEGTARFSGVSVMRLLESVGAAGETLRMSALNDYSVEMPVADLEEDAPIIATRMNGEIMPVREKGPYWVVYPFDSNPKYQTEATYARSVWQLKMLTLPR